MKNIVIIGGANGVGKAIAKMFMGNNILLVDVDVKHLTETASSLCCKYLVCDVCDPCTVKDVRAYVLRYEFNIDTLIICSGLWSRGKISNIYESEVAKMNSPERVARVVESNSFATMALIMQLTPLLSQNAGNQIIVVNATSGLDIDEDSPVYSAAMHSVSVFCKAIQKDLASIGKGVRLTNIYAGKIATNFQARVNDRMTEMEKERSLTAEDIAKTVLNIMSMPADVAIPSIELRKMSNF